MFDSACAACHHDGDGPTLLGVNAPLALNSQLTSSRPDTLLRTARLDVRDPAGWETQITNLVRDWGRLDVAMNIAGYLKPGYVEHKWAKLGEAVQWIRRAGGIAVIAHPARYSRFTPTQEYALITEFVAHGGRGIEVVTGSHSAADAVKYADTAREFGLLAGQMWARVVGIDIAQDQDRRTN